MPLPSMRLKTRIHEWLAERVSWIQYPDLRAQRRGLVWRYRMLSGKQRAWFCFAVFWSLAILLSIYGNLIS